MQENFQQRTPVPAPSVEAQRRACIRDAAMLLGADLATATDFSQTCSTLVRGVILHVLPTDLSEGPWVASAQVPRPAGVSEASWTDALLLANAQSMLIDDWAFGIATNGDGVLTMQLPQELIDPRFLAARFEGLLSMCQAVSIGAAATRDAARREGVTQ